MQVLNYIVTVMREDRPHSNEEYNTMPLNDTKITLRGALSSFPIALSTILWSEEIELVAIIAMKIKQNGAHQKIKQQRRRRHAVSM
jgi:hypothetical protein